MALVLQTISDSDFEHTVKVTTTGTTSTAVIADVSELKGDATNPRVSIVGVTWSVGSVTNIEWNADSNVVALSLTGNGSWTNISIPNNAGTGVNGDVHLSTAGASVGTVILHLRKVSGWDNIV